MAYTVSVSHIDTCLGSYLQDHHNREGELLVGVYVTNATTMKEISEGIMSEINSSDWGLPEELTDEAIQAAIDDEVPATDIIFDASLDAPSEDDDCAEMCQAWFVLNWSNEEG